MGYKLVDDLDRLIDREVAAVTDAQNPAAIREAIVGVLPRTPSGKFADCITADDVRAGLQKLRRKCPWMFAQPATGQEAYEDAILSKPCPAIGVDRDGYWRWMFCQQRKARRHA